MTDVRKKLEALMAKQGLTTGADLKRDGGKPPVERKTAQEPASLPDQSANEDTTYTTHKSYRSYENDPSDEAPPTPPPIPGANSLSERLALLNRHFNLLSGTQMSAQQQEEAEAIAEGRYDLPEVIEGEEWGGEAPFYLVRHELPLGYLHGNIELDAVLGSEARHIAFSACDAELHDFDPRKACFMDTETIGLAGGAGTVAFLVGVGYFTEDTFRLDQCFLRDYDEEEAMLRHVADIFAQCDTVVTYNGKSFDMPLLRTRCIQNRIPCRLDGMLHLDLVHVARRFFKQRLGDCSLGNVENEVLGIHRHGDVPSYLIPQMWFDYLRTRDARPLEGVFYHHKTDILSLVTLTAYLAQCLQDPNGQGFEHDEDRLAVVRLHFKHKQYDEVITRGGAFLEQEVQPLLRRECLEMVGMACKRRNAWEEMVRAFAMQLDEHPGDVRATLELAKHFEHRLRDLGEAERLCAAALTELATRMGSAGLQGEAGRALQQRLARIRKKLTKGRRMAEEADDDVSTMDLELDE
ncbi:MAG: ribonuclease H-like domain-containing protein [Candidatus Hydrogenedentes bacterium]|nr:ribonuclease H-like domain-containing protein [Candidatus Hydrogenedentota bacterium]